VADTQTNDTPVTEEVTTQPTDATTEVAQTETETTEAAPVEEAAPAAEAAPAEETESEPASSEPAVAEPAPAPVAEGKPARQPSMAQVMESDEFAAYMSGAETLARNSMVRGVVVRLEDNGSVLVDIGAKSEAIIPRNEVGDDEIGVGDEIECVVVKPEDDEGHPVVSKRRADFERIKREIAEAKNTGKILQATVKEAIKGGLIVDLGVAAFVPASHVDQKVRGQLDRLIGQVLPVKVIEVEFSKKRSDKVIASHRLAAEEERESRASEAWANIEKDKIVEGVVRRITDFGAFIDLGGVDGLLHVREMAWGRVEHPSNVVKKGQKLQVLILDIDETANPKRIALGLKQLLPDPWKKAAKNYRVGQTVTAKIVRLAPTVAFAELEPGVEAVIPVSELSEERVKEPGDVVTIGQEVEGRIKQILTNQRRITMSLRAAVQERERRETRTAVREVNQRADSDGPLRLGDLFGKELRAVRDRNKNRTREEARARAQEAAEDEEDYEELEDVVVEGENEEVTDITNGEPDVPADHDESVEG